VSDDKRHVDALLQSMREKAESERAELNRDADARIKEVLERSDREALRLKEDAMRDLDREVAVAIAGKLGLARMEARARMVRMKKSVMEGVFERAEQMVMATDGDRYAEVVGSLIREAVAASPEGGVLTVRNADVSVARKAVGDHPVTVKGVEADKGTVLLTGSSGSRRVDNGFRIRLSRARVALADRIGRALFEREPEASV
jgi:vacuolar-type H+-ATPase subunit E/Vma4